MKILLVNDDGYNAPGIRLLYKKLQNYGDVTLLAPLTHYSGASASFTLGKFQEFKKYEENIYSFDGTPVDCVLFATTSNKFDDFDLVVSGCNNGVNLSYDIIYSGTLGACSEALLHSLPAIAFSCDTNFDIVDKYFDEVFEYILNKKLFSNKYILNVNFPLRKFDEVKGIKISSLYIKKDQFYYEVKDGLYSPERYENFDNAPIDSDVYCANHGYISITPLAQNAYSEKYYQELKNKE